MSRRQQEIYQYSLIGFALVVFVGISIFFYRELNPEYKSYQQIYKQLEAFRSGYTHESPAPFHKGIKQILVQNESQGSESVDRCISCHVAMDLPHFSPTRIAHDVTGERLVEENPDYVWAKLDAAKLASLKQVTIGGRKINVEKVIQMHPLIGAETRPFEFHPLENYGCVSCHSGNGRSLVASRAHGPVFDGEYEPAESGHRPQFLEADATNEPLFSKMYNHKPGHELIFQTTPLLAGPLVEARCVQCHQPALQAAPWATQDKSTLQKTHSSVDRHLSTYQRGKELFISQACYACHRIAGFSRNNVGPELTRAGLNYPWYIKESIVWPQADLPSSTMPNFKLDHEELAALMTFLMAQSGESKAISEVDHRILLSEWEKGAQMPWEEAVALTESHAVSAGQLIFASQGCASCHKLAGFESAVCIANEDGPWFRSLIPEKISGSHLAHVVAEHAEDIDRCIKRRDAPEAILEEIESAFPGLMNAFYPNFKYAMRAYDSTLKDNPDQLLAYKERLLKVLKVYIQHYGLGREIGPNLSWSGVWRDDEWLLGHFHNPTTYTPKSLMPVLPFDESKFYLINQMLHKVGQKNREKITELWQREGFNPALAFEMLCSSCHGEHKQGNGPVSQWIFPIPKNLRDPVFLEHLSKQRAIDSITHGVKGTPMPPWGEANEGMRPVLSENEIAQLVDWLYRDIPASTPRKWVYQPSHVMGEMKKEKEYLQPLPKESDLVQAYFEERSIPCGPEKSSYYIREEFYTAQNLQNAQQFFEMNCAMCHGKEGAGTGLRASSMVEAKPRVFTDIPWIRSQDDMQLLRAIKFGVPGTAMVAWGDQTSAAQRMRLVLFIRSLSRLNIAREELQELLFENYDRKLMRVKEAQTEVYTQVESRKATLASAQQMLAALDWTQASQEQIGGLYLKVRLSEKEIKQAEGKVQVYQQMELLLKEERALYASIGETILAHNNLQLKEEYFEFVRQQPLEYSIQEGKLSVKEVPQTSTTFIDQLEEKESIKQKLADAAELRCQQLALYKELLNLPSIGSR